MISWLRRLVGKSRCQYWAWHEIEGDWYVLRCVRSRWHVSMHYIDPLHDAGLTE